MQTLIKKWDDLSIDEVQSIYGLRYEVFIVEQRIDEKVEMDDNNFEANSFIASINNTYVGTARCRSTENGVKLERFAVLKPISRAFFSPSITLEHIFQFLESRKFAFFIF